MITINVDEFHSNPNSDNGLRLSNGTSPSPSANLHVGPDNHIVDFKSVTQNDKESSLYNSSSEVFVDNECYIVPVADRLWDSRKCYSESVKKDIKNLCCSTSRTPKNSLHALLR